MRDQIETERLVLRQLEDRDAVPFSKYGSDFDIARMTGSFPHPFPLLSAEFKVLHLRALKRRGLAHPYAITLPEDDTFIGVADLFKRDAESLWEIGYWVARPFWGMGYVTEACKALLSEADASLGKQDRVAGVFKDNPGSIHVLKKLGFEVHGGPDTHFSMARLCKADGINFVLRADS